MQNQQHLVLESSYNSTIFRMYSRRFLPSSVQNWNLFANILIKPEWKLNFFTYQSGQLGKISFWYCYYSEIKQVLQCRKKAPVPYTEVPPCLLFDLKPSLLLLSSLFDVVFFMCIAAICMCVTNWNT